jgi:hypothetical protein
MHTTMQITPKVVITVTEPMANKIQSGIASSAAPPKDEDRQLRKPARRGDPGGLNRRGRSGGLGARRAGAHR